MSVYTVAPSCQIKTLPEIYARVFGERTGGAYVEVGAFDGLNWSNTSGLAALGWRGLLFEPNPEYYERCRQNYAGFPQVAVENCCIGDRDGTAKLYLGGSISTTVAAVVDVYGSLDWGRFSGLSHEHAIDCPLYTLDTMLDRHGWPADFELLVIDVEGAELQVLAGLDLERYRPQMLIVETHEAYPDERLSWKAPQVERRLAAYGYQKIYFDTINSIYTT